MSDTDAPDRLTRARSEMDEAHAHLKGALSVFDDGTKPEPSDGAWKLLARMTAEHTRALRELFLASLEAPDAKPTEPPKPKPATYVAGGPAYRVLRSRAHDTGDFEVVAAVNRLADFAGTEEDVRLVAGRLRAAGRHDVADDLLRNVEG